MSIDMVIRIDQEGNITTLYRDRSPVRDMGMPKIFRASDVKFNNGIQKWEIFEHGNKIGKSHYYREHAIQEEIEILENRLMN